jgi:hypothetical protein
MSKIVDGVAYGKVRSRRRFSGELSSCDSGSGVPRRPRRDDAASSCGSRSLRVTDRDQKTSKMVGARHGSRDDNLELINYDADL